MAFKKKAAAKVEEPEPVPQPEDLEVYEPENVWKVDQVPTETMPVIRSKEGKTYDIYSALAELLNRTEE